MIRNTNRDTTSVDGLYIVKSGVAKVTKPSQSWEAEAVLAILGHGHCFGEIGLLDGLPPSANVTAMNLWSVTFCHGRTFYRLLKKILR